MEPTITVIVSTFNGARKLPFLLEGLIKQTRKNFELLVVVDGSTDNTLQVLEEYRSSFEIFRIVEQINSGRSKVRNRGAAQAIGELLIFFDDDMVPSPDSIMRHYLTHIQKDRILVSGNQMEYEDITKTDIQNYKATRTQKWVSKYKEGMNQLTIDNLFFTAANCSIRKSLFEFLGGFDERLTDVEDYDLAVRALQSNISVFFDKDNIAIHRDFITAKSYALRLQQYRNAHHQRRDDYKSEQIIPTKAVTKRLVYLFFSATLWLRVIDWGGFSLLPKRARYKLFDVILHAHSLDHQLLEK